MQVSIRLECVPHHQWCYPQHLLTMHLRQWRHAWRHWLSLVSESHVGPAGTAAVFTGDRLMTPSVSPEHISHLTFIESLSMRGHRQKERSCRGDGGGGCDSRRGRRAPRGRRGTATEAGRLQLTPDRETSGCTGVGNGLADGHQGFCFCSPSFATALRWRDRFAQNFRQIILNPFQWEKYT